MKNWNESVCFLRKIYVIKIKSSETNIEVSRVNPDNMVIGNFGLKSKKTYDDLQSMNLA